MSIKDDISQAPLGAAHPDCTESWLPAFLQPQQNTGFSVLWYTLPHPKGGEDRDLHSANC